MNDYPADQVHGTDPDSAAFDGRAVGASLTPLALQYLDQTRPWVRFMSVVTFVSAGLTMVIGVVMMVISMFAGARAGTSEGLDAVVSAGRAAGVALVYMALAVVYLAPGLYLSRYASAIKRLKEKPTAGELEDTLKHQKSFWRFIGILTVIGVVVGVIVVGLAVVAGVIGAIMAGRS